MASSDKLEAKFGPFQDRSGEIDPDDPEEVEEKPAADEQNPPKPNGHRSRMRHELRVRNPFPQPAKTIPKASDSNDKKVFWMAEVLAAGQWPSDSTGYEFLRRRWGCSVSNIARLVNMANAGLKLVTGDTPERLEALAKLRLYQIGQEDGRDRVHALKTILLEGKKSRHRGRSPGEDEDQTRDPEAVRDRMVAALTKLPEKYEEAVREAMRRPGSRLRAVVEDELRTIETVGVGNNAQSSLSVQEG